MLLDSLLLSKCDFLLKTTSAVAEFAIWVNIGRACGTRTVLSPRTVHAPRTLLRDPHTVHAFHALRHAHLPRASPTRIPHAHPPVAAALHDAHLDLQWEDRFHSQRLPAWVASVGADDAQAHVR